MTDHADQMAGISSRAVTRHPTVLPGALDEPRGERNRPARQRARLAPMPGLEEARAKGASAIDALRVTLAERAAELLRRDPDLHDTAVEVGLVDRAWLEEPGQHPVRTAPALDVVQRFLERSVERRPSALSAIGLNALQLLSQGGTAEEGTPSVPVAIV